MTEPTRIHNHRRLPTLCVSDLSAGYPDDRRAVYGVNFDVYAGERVAVVGPNGAGKSTMFKAIAGIIPFTTGEISESGRDCSTSHGHVGYVPQYTAVDWNFPATVGDVVMMGRARQIGWLRWASREDWRAVRRALDQVGMLAHIDRRAGRLSGGQRQRVFIARALAQDAAVLLLDEPFSGVDVTAADEILDTLDRVRADGVTVLVATHDMELATTQFDRMMLLNRRLIAYGTPAEVYTPDNLKAAYGSRVAIMRDGDRTLVALDQH